MLAIFHVLISVFFCSQILLCIHIFWHSLSVYQSPRTCINIVVDVFLPRKLPAWECLSMLTHTIQTKNSDVSFKIGKGTSKTFCGRFSIPSYYKRCLFPVHNGTSSNLVFNVVHIKMCSSLTLNHRFSRNFYMLQNRSKHTKVSIIWNRHTAKCVKNLALNTLKKSPNNSLYTQLLLKVVVLQQSSFQDPLFCVPKPFLSRVVSVCRSRFIYSLSIGKLS